VNARTQSKQLVKTIPGVKTMPSQHVPYTRNYGNACT